MTVRIYAAMGNELLVAGRRNGDWRTERRLTDSSPQTVAADPLRPEVVYCGTFDRGLWRSVDAGESWEQVGENVVHDPVMAAAVSAVERNGEHGVVYAGTEPSAVYRSEDGGETWRELGGLSELPSAPEWSFPPRPETHHVRWISPDPNTSGRLFVAIEAGALIQTPDGGETWEDVVVSAASSPWQAHNPRAAESTIYRKSAGEPWREVREGLPDVEGRVVAVLAANQDEPGVFYALTSEGLYRSPDAGSSWERLEIGRQDQFGRPTGLVVAEIG
ncbi:MAG: hypothetical protein LC781_17125 [Actinobacteria bacterium]|nr:hypothetical protein [Actinomycetota bacterium]